MWSEGRSYHHTWFHSGPITIWVHTFVFGVFPRPSWIISHLFHIGLLQHAGGHKLKCHGDLCPEGPLSKGAWTTGPQPRPYTYIWELEIANSVQWELSILLVHFMPIRVLLLVDFEFCVLLVTVFVYIAGLMLLLKYNNVVLFPPLLWV